MQRSRNIGRTREPRCRDRRGLFFFLKPYTLNRDAETLNPKPRCRDRRGGLLEALLRLSKGLFKALLDSLKGFLRLSKDSLKALLRNSCSSEYRLFLLRGEVL